MPTKIILDPGSCHMGKLDYAKELIRLAVDVGANAIKFQLFKNLPPNIELPYEWFTELVQYGNDLEIEVFASVFNYESFGIVEKCCSSIKFSFSQRYSDFIKFVDEGSLIKNLYISGIIDTIFPKNAIKLYCIPQYPVPFIIDFEGIFPRFDGFSDHTLGFKQTIEAVRQGAKVIEKHFTLNYADISCPDNNFALRPHELTKMVKAIRYMESGL